MRILIPANQKIRTYTSAADAAAAITYSQQAGDQTIRVAFNSVPWSRRRRRELVRLIEISLWAVKQRRVKCVSFKHVRTYPTHVVVLVDTA